MSLLEKWAHRATLARDGRAGPDLLMTRRYDLVLMDMQVPEMGGLEATRRFRAQETGKRTPIVASALRNALAGGDRDRLRRTAHSIKGNSAIFGATPVVQEARAIEPFDPDRDARGGV